MKPLTYLEVQQGYCGEGLFAWKAGKPNAQKTSVPTEVSEASLENSGTTKEVTSWRHPQENIISINEGGASSCFVHYVPCISLWAQAMMGVQEIFVEWMNKVERQGTTRISLNNKECFGRT